MSVCLAASFSGLWGLFIATEREATDQERTPLCGDGPFWGCAEQSDSQLRARPRELEGAQEPRGPHRAKAAPAPSCAGHVIAGGALAGVTEMALTLSAPLPETIGCTSRDHM